MPSSTIISVAKKTDESKQHKLYIILRDVYKIYLRWRYQERGTDLIPLPDTQNFETFWVIGIGKLLVVWKILDCHNIGVGKEIVGFISHSEIWHCYGKWGILEGIPLPTAQLGITHRRGSVLDPRRHSGQDGESYRRQRCVLLLLLLLLSL